MLNKLYVFQAKYFDLIRFEILQTFLNILSVRSLVFTENHVENRPSLSRIRNVAAAIMTIVGLLAFTVHV